MRAGHAVWTSALSQMMKRFSGALVLAGSPGRACGQDCSNENRMRASLRSSLPSSLLDSASPYPGSPGLWYSSA